MASGPASARAHGVRDRARLDEREAREPEH